MKWMPFYNRVTYKRCLIIYKVNTNLVPQYVQCVTLVTSIHPHKTGSAARCAFKLYICNVKLKYFTRCFKYESATVWDNLDNYTKFAPSIW